MTACSWDSISSAVHSDLPRKAGLSYEKSRLIKMRYNIFLREIPKIVSVYFLDWVEYLWTGTCHGSKNDGWQMNAITCCNESNRYICLREESAWIVFHVVFFNLDISQLLCFSWVSRSKLLSRENTAVHRNQGLCLFLPKPIVYPQSTWNIQHIKWTSVRDIKKKNLLLWSKNERSAYRIRTTQGWVNDNLYYKL